MKVKGKIIMITGGGNGLGRELVLNLLHKGSKVVALDINKTALEEIRQLAGKDADSLMTIETDITDGSKIEDAAKKISNKFKAIDGVINNAGIIQPFRKVNDLDANTINRVFEINFMGTLNIIKVFLPYLLERSEAHIVNISSMGGFLPVAGQAIYGASKAAVKILSEALTSELSETNIGVTTVFPGAMLTNIKANSGLGADAGAGPEGHSKDAAFSPAKAAEMITDAIEHNKPRLYIGKDAKFMNILYKLNPGMATHWIYSKINHKM
ncbi:MAG: SDR family NAD(P)-dependent oxidoreductase [Tannerellaceae bacterium]|jgi:short-subunit dehydrogenase|nr:SDR family NAD(P)-dependent oxidoreductase [Tannerellaceae bacterium]